MSGKVTHGADVEALDEIAVGLRRQGTRIADVGGRGAVHLEKLRALWDGPDFEKFAKEWRVAHRAIDDAEHALQNYSRKLVAEADSQRSSSGVATVGLGGGSGPGLRAGRVEHNMAFGEIKDGYELGRVDDDRAFERVDGGPAESPRFRVDPLPDPMEPPRRWVNPPPFIADPPLLRVDPPDVQLPVEPPVRVEPLPDGLTGVVVDGTDGPNHLESPHGMLVTDNLMAVLPDLPGGEELELGQSEPVAFERMDSTGGPDSGSGEAFERVDGAESSPPPAVTEAPALQEAPVQESPTPPQESPAPAPAAPTQIPSEDGAHITTADDAAGQRSVAFDPRGVVDQADWADASTLGGWLGIEELDLLPWNQG